MYLLDTHVLIWSLFDTDKLSDKAEQITTENDNVFVSIVSLWEIAIWLYTDYKGFHHTEI